MTVLKRLERGAKTSLAIFAGWLLWRPGRRRRSAPARPSKILLVRIDDRLGEVLLITPLLRILKEQLIGARLDVLLHRNRTSILRGHPDVDRVIPFEDRWLFLGPLAPGIRPLRRERYDAVVDCTNWTDPSVRSAIVSRLIGAPSVVVGPAAFPVARLYSKAVAPREDTVSELEQRVQLLSPLARIDRLSRLTFRPPRPSKAIQPLLASLRAAPYGVINPGGRLDWRRLPPSAFAAAANALSAMGLRPVITWGPGEGSLARSVSNLAPGSILAPATDVDDLAALLDSAALTVCNNTGPMHLSVALGTPTLALFVKMPPERWGHPYSPHRMVDLTSTIDAVEVDSRLRSEITHFVQQLRTSSDAAANASVPGGAPRPPT